MGTMTAPRVLTILLLVLGCSCRESSRTTGDAGTALRGVTAGSGVGLGQLPSPEGPFVEPPLDPLPTETWCVLAGRVAEVSEAAALMGQLLRVTALPAGYPAVDQASEFFTSASGFVVLAGKFGRRAYAQGLFDVLKKAGFERALMVSRPYRHDRLSPALNASDGIKAGVVFSGVAGVDVILLARPGRDAAGTGRFLADGAVVPITGRQEFEGETWFQVGSGKDAGFVPCNRVLVEYNAFPSPSGRQAVVGVPLACGTDGCRWDYWLVGRGMLPRQLLVPAARTLSFGFSADGAWLAYSSGEGRLMVVSESPRSPVDLGPGTGPWFAPDGGPLYFRRPGIKGSRDEVVAAASPGWRVRTVLDYPGEPTYPLTINSVPQPLEPYGRNLIATFMRQVRADGGTEWQLAKVLFTPDGKILDRRVEPLTE